MNSIVLMFSLFLLFSGLDEPPFAVASIYRTELYKSFEEISPRSPEEIIVVLRLTDIDIETFRENTSGQRPVLVIPEGEIEAAVFESSAERVFTDMDGVVVKIITPLLIGAFRVPRTVEGTVKIKVGNLPAVELQLPEFISVELSFSDID